MSTATTARAILVTVRGEKFGVFPARFDALTCLSSWRVASAKRLFGDSTPRSIELAREVEGSVMFVEYQGCTQEQVEDLLEDTLDAEAWADWVEAGTTVPDMPGMTCRVVSC